MSSCVRYCLIMVARQTDRQTHTQTRILPTQVVFPLHWQQKIGEIGHLPLLCKEDMKCDYVAKYMRCKTKHSNWRYGTQTGGGVEGKHNQGAWTQKLVGFFLAIIICASISGSDRSAQDERPRKPEERKKKEGGEKPPGIFTLKVRFLVLEVHFGVVSFWCWLVLLWWRKLLSFWNALFSSSRTNTFRLRLWGGVVFFFFTTSPSSSWNVSHSTVDFAITVSSRSFARRMIS